MTLGYPPVLSLLGYSRHYDQQIAIARLPTGIHRAARALRTAFLGLLLLATGSPAVSTAAQVRNCTFESNFTSPAGCFFVEQKKEDGQPRATIINSGRGGTTSVRLHTKVGDNQVHGSGEMERNDLYHAVGSGGAPVVFNEGADQWWAVSILFPDDFPLPTPSGEVGTIRWHPYSLVNFHHEGGSGFPIFELGFRQDPASPLNPGILAIRGHGGNTSANPAVSYQSLPIPSPKRNVWYDFVFHVKWSAEPFGFFAAWVREGSGIYKRILHHAGPTLYVGEGVYLKLAHYHVPVCDPYPACIGSHSASSVIYDRVIQGTRWEDVALQLGQLEGQHEENAAVYGSTPPSWTQWGPAQGSFSGGTAVASNQINATVSFTFTGTSVLWMGTRCETCGTANVSINGGAQQSVSTVGPNTEGNLVSEGVWSSPTLPFGTHTIVITNTSNQNIAVDGFWVNPLTTGP
jgi:hypothetical protein